MDDGKKKIKKRRPYKRRPLKKTRYKRRQTGGSTYCEQANKTHRCGSLFKRVMRRLLWPFKMFKRFLERIGVAGYFQEAADKNKDYVLLFHVVSFLVVIGLLYFLFKTIFGGDLAFDRSYVGQILKTMDSFDLPMSEAINADAEREALNCWSSYFSANPFSFTNSGLFDVVRGMVFLPLVALLLYLLPYIIILYVLWLLYHYASDIINALVGLVKKGLWFFTEFIICEVSGPVPLWSYSCPDFAETFTGWREEYVDAPVYRERLKYLKGFYKTKWNVWDRGLLQLRKWWKRGRVQNDYANKFWTRGREVFYEKALNLNSRVEDGIAEASDFIEENVGEEVRRLGQNVREKVSNLTPDLNFSEKGRQVLEEGAKGACGTFKKVQVISSLVGLVFLLALIAFLGTYAFTGKPQSLYEFLGPLWRSKDLGSRLQLLSSRYNWLGIGLLIGVVTLGFLLG